ncbi:hypothetical protein ABZ901_04755 [Actinacidiphila alni]|uniref:hypothetical protein n=1 Tax=Actinacidiphila alni TaxID=380248 RepID=UPI0033C4026C
MAATAGGPVSGAGPLDDGERAELTALRARVAGLTSRHRLRSFFSAVLITLAAVFAPLSAVAVWVADVVGSTDRYVQTMAPLADNPHVQAGIADRVTSAVMDRVDLDSLLSSVTPSDRPGIEAALGGLSGPIGAGVKDFVHGTVLTFVSSGAFSTVWEQLNRQAHTAIVDALTGSNDSAVQVENNTVTLDLAPVVATVKQQLVDRGLKAAASIPEVRTDFTLVKSDEIGRVKTGFRALQLAGDWLPVVAVVVAGAGVLLAVRRRRALVAAALGIAAGVAVLGIALALFRTFYLDHLAPDVHHAAAAAVYDQVVRFLRASVRMVITLGVVVALGAWLSGPGRWAVRVRAMWESGIAAVREAAGVTSLGPVGPWVNRFRVWLRWAVVAVASVVLALWSYPTGMVIFWIAVVALVGLAVVEFLDERPADTTAAQGDPHEPGSGATAS